MNDRGSGTATERALFTEATLTPSDLYDSVRASVVSLASAAYAQADISSTMGGASPRRSVPNLAPRTHRERELRWLREHRAEFAGEWVALAGDHLLAHGSNAIEVYRAARRKGVQTPFIAQVEPPDRLPFGGW